MPGRIASVVRIGSVGLIVACAAGLALSLDAATAEAEQGPAQVTINRLPGPKKVTFSHINHTKHAKCESCHHAGKQATCSGADCHGTKAQGEALGLKSAFHKQCIPCHRKNKAPSKCAGAEGCHGS